MVRSVLSTAVAVLRVQMWETVPASAQSLLASIVAEKVVVRMAQIGWTGGGGAGSSAATTNSDIQFGGTLVGSSHNLDIATGTGTLNSANLITGTLTINGGSANMQTGAVTTGLATLAGGNLTSNAAFNGCLTATGATLYTTHNGTTTTTL
ncbi:MAG: hypothetical protein NT172_01495, partial [Planctomycetota bacterium]|nr:hypothetical protein [Planctomycetota bacterium]